MGFFDAMKKMVQGKPLFEVPAEKAENIDPADPNAAYKKDLPPEEPGKRSVEPSRRYDERGKKVLPRAEMIYCRCQKSGESMQVWATIRNQSEMNVYLTKVILCGSSMQFDYPLAPAQQHDFMIYDGKKPPSPDDCYAETYYKDYGTGDTYVLQHMVNFRDDQDGTFSPLSFQPLMAQGVNRNLI